jgi:hypothetical protein
VHSGLAPRERIQLWPLLEYAYMLVSVQPRWGISLVLYCTLYIFYDCDSLIIDFTMYTHIVRPSYILSAKSQSIYPIEIWFRTSHARISHDIYLQKPQATCKILRSLYYLGPVGIVCWRLIYYDIAGSVQAAVFSPEVDNWLGRQCLGQSRYIDIAGEQSQWI